MNIRLSLLKIVFIISISVLATGTLADIIVPRRPVKLCVKISNLDKFPKIALIAQVSNPRNMKYLVYQIFPGQCLKVGRKGSQTKIFWTYKEIMDSLQENELNDLLNSEDHRFHSFNIDIPTGQEYEDPKKSISEKVQVYFLEYDCQHKLVLKKSKEVIKFSNGFPDKVVFLDKPSAKSNKQ